MSKETMKELNGMNIKQLKQLFEITEKQQMSVELAMVRGWLMDAIYAKLGEEAGDLYFGI